MTNASNDQGRRRLDERGVGGEREGGRKGGAEQISHPWCSCIFIKTNAGALRFNRITSLNKIASRGKLLEYFVVKVFCKGRR